ncbi:MAG TPA: GspH/FimT family pseudopilin [Syntrophales bacterium]|nr:GspH/FimT family pseudopilin [Syntrophales bacterium]
MKNFFQSGFTLIELMIVIAIMGIMMALAVPSYQTYMAQRRLNGAARQVMSDLMAARMKAITQNNEFKVFFPGSHSGALSGNHQYQILDDDDDDGASSTDEAIEIKDIQTNYTDVTMNANNNPVFSPKGTVTNLATVTLSNSRGSKTVSIAITGRVKID